MRTEKQDFSNYQSQYTIPEDINTMIKSSANSLQALTKLAPILTRAMYKSTYLEILYKIFNKALDQKFDLFNNIVQSFELSISLDKKEKIGLSPGHYANIMLFILREVADEYHNIKSLKDTLQLFKGLSEVAKNHEVPFYNKGYVDEIKKVFHKSVVRNKSIVSNDDFIGVIKIFQKSGLRIVYDSFFRNLVVKKVREIDNFNEHQLADMLKFLFKMKWFDQDINEASKVKLLHHSKDFIERLPEIICYLYGYDKRIIDDLESKVAKGMIALTLDESYKLTIVLEGYKKESVQSGREFRHQEFLNQLLDTLESAIPGFISESYGKKDCTRDKIENGLKKLSIENLSLFNTISNVLKAFNFIKVKFSSNTMLQQYEDCLLNVIKDIINGSNPCSNYQSLIEVRRNIKEQNDQPFPDYSLQKLVEKDLSNIVNIPNLNLNIMKK